MRLLLTICLVSPAASLSSRTMPQSHRSPLPVNRCPITMRIVGAQSNHAGVAMAENTAHEESEATRTQTSRPRKPVLARFERAAASRQAVDVTGALGQAAQLPRPRTLAFAEAGKDAAAKQNVNATAWMWSGPAAGVTVLLFPLLRSRWVHEAAVRQAAEEEEITNQSAIGLEKQLVRGKITRALVSIGAAFSGGATVIVVIPVVAVEMVAPLVCLCIALGMVIGLAGATALEAQAKLKELADATADQKQEDNQAKMFRDGALIAIFTGVVAGGGGEGIGASVKQALGLEK